MTQTHDLPEQVELQAMTRRTVDQLLQLKVTHDLVRHVIDETREDWRSYVARLHEQYPIRGIGVIATPDALASHDYDGDAGGFLHGDEDVAPEEIISNLNDYPLQAATAAYAFSLVEVYGNDVANLFKPGSVRPLGSWHTDIKFDLDSRDTAQSLRAAAAFAKLFDGDPADIKPASVIRLVAMRRARNDYVHRKDTGIAFDRFLAYCLAVVCQIHFLKASDQSALKVYPWEAFDEKWRGQASHY